MGQADPSGRLLLDSAKVTAELRLDGKYLLATSDPVLPAGEVALGYKNLLEAERSFRDMKSTLALHPVYYRLEPRIRAYVLLCWLALLLVRVAERRTSMTWATINRQLGRVHAVTLTGTAGTVVHTTPLTTARAGIVAACGLPHPSAVTALDPTRPAQTSFTRRQSGLGTRPHPQNTHISAGQTLFRASCANQLRNSGKTRLRP